MKKILIIGFITASLAGCAIPVVEKNLVPVGGNKAGATVKMAYNYYTDEKPVVDYSRANEEATKTCKIWGYQNAREFGGQTKRCIKNFAPLNDGSYYSNAYGYYGCSEYEVSVEYQCY